MNLDAFLSRYRGRNVFYKPNMGNGGDALIAAGAFKYFERHNIEVEIIKKLDEFDAKNKIVFYPGGGNLIDDYTNGADFFREYHSIAEEIILMPHTVNGHQHLLESFGENITLFAREQQTLTFLKSLKLNCKTYLDHDLALILNPEDFKPFRSNRPKLLKADVLKRKLKNIKFNFNTLNAFRDDVERSDISLPKDNLDVSNSINYRYQMDDLNLIYKSVADIFMLVDQFNVINTNRLHISIAAALLNKKVNLFPNSYWKNEAIYQYSLKCAFPKLNFVKDR